MRARLPIALQQLGCLMALDEGELSPKPHYSLEWSIAALLIYILSRLRLINTSIFQM